MIMCYRQVGIYRCILTVYLYPKYFYAKVYACMHTVYIFFTYLYCIQYRYVEDKHVDMDIMAWRNQNTGH